MTDYLEKQMEHMRGRLPRRFLSPECLTVPIIRWRRSRTQLARLEPLKKCLGGQCVLEAAERVESEALKKWIWLGFLGYCTASEGEKVQLGDLLSQVAFTTA